MFICLVCRHPTPVDDTIVRSEAGYCICLRCVERQGSGLVRVPDDLLTAVVEAAGVCRGHHCTPRQEVRDCCVKPECTLTHCPNHV